MQLFDKSCYNCKERKSCDGCKYSLDGNILLFDNYFPDKDIIDVQEMISKELLLKNYYIDNESVMSMINGELTRKIAKLSS